MFPDKDGVATLHVRGPAEQIVAAYKALDDWATGLRATGDSRTRGQIMCQTLVERVTGLQHADACDVEINLVLDAETLLAGGDTPVELDGHGPISPDVAADIIVRAPSASVRRLLTDPVDGKATVWRTPTGHAYRSEPPPLLPGHPRQQSPARSVQQHPQQL
ncbi:MAG: hypothetical protein ABW075_07065 [Aeromicrobium sp.]